MKDNKGGIVDFPLRYIDDIALRDALDPLRRGCAGIISDDELYRGAQLAKGILNPVTYSAHFPC